MFSFKYLSDVFEVEANDGEITVTPDSAGAKAYVEQVYEDITTGEYFPDPSYAVYLLSEKLGGDYEYTAPADNDEDPNTIY